MTFPDVLLLCAGGPGCWGCGMVNATAKGSTTATNAAAGSTALQPGAAAVTDTRMAMNARTRAADMPSGSSTTVNSQNRPAVSSMAEQTASTVGMRSGAIGVTGARPQAKNLLDPDRILSASSINSRSAQPVAADSMQVAAGSANDVNADRGNARPSASGRTSGVSTTGAVRDDDSTGIRPTTASNEPKPRANMRTGGLQRAAASVVTKKPVLHAMPAKQDAQSTQTDGTAVGSTGAGVVATASTASSSSSTPPMATASAKQGRLKALHRPGWGSRPEIPVPDLAEQLIADNSMQPDLPIQHEIPSAGVIDQGARAFLQPVVDPEPATSTANKQGMSVLGFAAALIGIIVFVAGLVVLAVISTSADARSSLKRWHRSGNASAGPLAPIRKTLISHGSKVTQAMMMHQPLLSGGDARPSHGGLEAFLSSVRVEGARDSYGGSVAHNVTPRKAWRTASDATMV